jgi:hypothetical protein
VRRILERWFGGGGKRRHERTAVISPAGLPPAPAPMPVGDAGRTVATPPRGVAPTPAPTEAVPTPIPPLRLQHPPEDSSADATRYASTVSTAPGSVVGVLIAVEGELEGEVYRLFDGEMRIGRGSSCEVVLPSEWVSREHARVTHRGGAFAIESLSERNPTFVNDARTEGGELSDGDLLRIGKTTLRFRTVH